MAKRGRDLLILLALTFAALCVHGYHPWAEDAEIYLPNVKQALHPALYPVGAEFFQPYGRLSLAPKLLEWSIRLTHLPFDWAVFLWQIATIYLLLYACWRLGGRLFASEAARWAGVLAVAGLLTLPVAGTALYIMDQYVTSRSMVTPAEVFLALYVVERKRVKAGAWFALGVLVHPLMGVFAGSYAAVLWWALRRGKRSNSHICRQGSAAGAGPGGGKCGAPTGSPTDAAALLPLGISLGGTPPPGYDQALATRSYFFLRYWAWYEWLGAVAPLLLFAWFARLARRRKMRELEVVSWAAAVYGAIYFLGAIVFTVPTSFVGLAKLQPMRFLHLEYILLLVAGGGLLGEFVLRRRVWLWLALFLPLFGGMYYASRQLFPATRQVEWPGADSGNRWVEAFRWVRHNTPVDAVFALDPRHMALPGEDQQGFRVIAERSRLADAVKDSGAVTMFPQIAPEWRRESQAQSGWDHFTRADFLRLKREYGVTWVVLQQPDSKGLSCPYSNPSVLVCRVE
jgi:hypothetical protein